MPDSVRSRLARVAFRADRNTRFVILSTGRTGSELLVSLLDSHPDVVCESELLALRRPAPRGTILYHSMSAHLKGAKAYGFKLLAHHAGLQRAPDPAGFIRSFHEVGFRFILLEREDLLGQAFSSLRAAANRYHYRRGDATDFQRDRFDPVGVLATLWLIEENLALLQSATESIPALRLSYERDLISAEQQQRTVDQVSRYLGLEPAPVTTDLVKVAPASPADQVANFDEIKDLLVATRYARLLAPTQWHPHAPSAGAA